MMRSQSRLILIILTMILVGGLSVWFEILPISNYFVTEQAQNESIETISSEEFASLLRKTQAPHEQTSHETPSIGLEQNTTISPKKKLEIDSQVVRLRQQNLRRTSIKLLDTLDIVASAPDPSKISIHTRSITGDTISTDQSSDWKLVNFWATWCAPCREEMPSLNHLSDRFGRQLQVIGVNVGESRVKVLNFKKRFELNFPIIIDKKGILAREFGTRFLPETWLIGPENRVYGLARGARDWDGETTIKLFETLIRNETS